ncbi:MAG TPA: hypothetical protein VLM17_03585 [Xanthomonadaceae bacterium]|nr:hypothetical protein [Xanthomonadaceae bacterium]
MTRKLLRTMTALSATATVFTVLLLAARPVAPAPLPAALAVDAAQAFDLGVDAEADGPALRQRHHLHRARALLALPYFSFAQGLRRSRS